MLDTAFPPWPSFSQKEIDAVSSVLSSNRVNQWTGSEVGSFEREFAEFAGTKYAIAVANGTLALDVALKALEIGVGDEVIATPRTFMASVSSILLTGAKAVFADVDRDTQNLDMKSVEAAITARTKAIVIVHLAGMPANMDEVKALAKVHNLKVIEDCAQAHGAAWNGQPVGGIGDIGAWSFCQDKIMSTGGEGGMITTNNEALWRHMWSFKDHGKGFDAVFDRDHPPGFRWVHESIGTNARLTEMQAAIGRIQLNHMPKWHEARLSYATQIWNACKEIAWLRVPEIDPRAVHAAYKCYVFIRPELLPATWTRDAVIGALQDLGIPAYQGSCSEVYLEKAFDNSGCRPPERLPVAKELGETSLMFLVHPTLESQHISATIDALKALDTRIQAS